VLDSLAELYGFMITENKFGTIVLSAKESKRINLNFKFVTAYDALRQILKSSTESYIVSPVIAKLTKSLSMNLKNYKIKDALYAVAQAFNLKITKGKGGVLIIHPNYKKVKLKKRKAKKVKKKILKLKKKLYQKKEKMSPSKK
ncbi:hypothetical protein MJH12_18230, partial [bacterium]|nr:hypothetical protein [bacterium]